jgi:hypothetical protein
MIWRAARRPTSSRAAVGSATVAGDAPHGFGTRALALQLSERTLGGTEVLVCENIDVNLLEVLRARIEALPQGAHDLGMRAVLQHVQVALNHLNRGEKTGDETAFTDAIYRTNQAFEGSLKEAYRVLTGADPSKLRPYDIENHFQSARVLRPRVLSQLTTYRTEWRNPSAHDYQLDFDEDEALLAIVSVCAFAIVLVDQMAEKIGFNDAKAAAAASTLGTPAAGPLVEQLVAALEAFVYKPPVEAADEPVPRGYLVGALSGYLTVAVPGVTIESDKRFGDKDEVVTVDIIASRASQDRVVIELRRSVLFTFFRQTQVTRLVRHMTLTEAKFAILYTPKMRPGEMIREDTDLRNEGLKIIDLRPKPSAASA